MHIRMHGFDFSKCLKMLHRDQVNGMIKKINISLLVALLGLCLFGEPIIRYSGVIGVVIKDKFAFLESPDTQWVVLMFFVAYAIGLVTAINNLRGQKCSKFSICVLAICFFSTVNYFRDVSCASSSCDALIFLSGLAACLGLHFYTTRSDMDLKLKLYRAAIRSIVLFMGLASICPQYLTRRIKYHNELRGSGPWNNPNTFGLLMGVGAVSGLGILMMKAVLKHRCEARKNTTGLNSLPRLNKFNKYGALLLLTCIIVGMLIFQLLFRSYSRGAWLASISGASYLGIKWIQLKVSDYGRYHALRRQILKFLICTASMFLIIGWNCHYAKLRIVRRALSSININDFSWRNRVSAWVGAMDMIADRPFLGFGWNRAEAGYDGLYKLARVKEPLAIEMNSYLFLGVSSGLLVLISFIVLVASLLFDVSFADTSKFNIASPMNGFGGGAVDGRMQQMENKELRRSNCEKMTNIAEEEGFAPELDWAKGICRAGAIVLLVGFWFDGGLFELATGPVFWILLALSAA